MNLRRKISYLTLVAIFVILFSVWQVFFLKKVFNIDLFAKSILPDGFCKDCNVILISLDSLRAKSLPCYGYEKNTAPNLCNFAQKSFLFKNVYTPSSKTLDSHFSIFTGLYPKSHGMNVPFTNVLNEKIRTLPQFFESNGYTTLFSGPLIDPHLPLDRGFERGFGYKEYGDEPRFWFDNMKKYGLLNRKFFAFLHTYDVHEPYIPKKENISLFYPNGILTYVTENDLCKSAYIKIKSQNLLRPKERKVRENEYCRAIEDYEKGISSEKENTELYIARIDPYWDTFKGLDDKTKKEYTHSLYASVIYEMDLELDKFFNKLEDNKLLDSTIVVITADHGEEFFEHGGKSHAEKLYNESIQVPLIIYVPKSRPQVIDKLVSSVDIMPSILSLVGIDQPPNVSGINMFSRKNNEFVIAQHVTTNLTTLISSKWKLIINNGKKELYDMINDPVEQNNLIYKHQNIAQDLDVKLSNFLLKLPTYNSTDSEPFPSWIDEDQRKKLIETGYF